MKVSCKYIRPVLSQKKMIFGKLKVDDFQRIQGLLKVKVEKKCRTEVTRNVWFASTDLQQCAYCILMQIVASYSREPFLSRFFYWYISSSVRDLL